MGPRVRFLSVRRSAALSVTLLAAQAVVFGLAVRHAHGASRVDLTTGGRLLTLLVGAALLALGPRLWRGTRTATTLAICGLIALAALNAVASRWAPAAIQVALATVLTIWSILRPAARRHGHSDIEALAARALIEAHGTDSLSPFLVRPDKELAFAAGGMLAYRVIGSTAVVSADPVGPPGCAGPALEAFRAHARSMGWRVVVWGASSRHLDAYRSLGMHAVRAGEEAFVDPSGFTLEGRAVRKLRQSVQRARRRGWSIETLEGREVGLDLEAEIGAVEAQWRRDHPRILGFAMSMGPYGSELRADDLLALARSPEGELRAVMRFARCRDLLSLDTMQRVGETPNGLNEALVAAAIEAARELGVAEVSLNYAGMSHLLREGPAGGLLCRAAKGIVLRPLRHHFQMDRLVRFNEKFSPEWRPRYLVCESRSALAGAIVRVLQAEGHLPASRRGRLTPAGPRVRTGALPVRTAPPPREPVGERR